jgi:hypothetical protein
VQNRRIEIVPQPNLADLPPLDDVTAASRRRVAVRSDVMFHGHDHRYHHRHASFADTGVGVVIAAEFRKMCLPRNPTTTTPSRSATTSMATAVIATRLPRPILTFFTIWSIAWSFSMSQSIASIVPMQWTKVPPGKRVQILPEQYQVHHSRGLRSSSLWWKRSMDVGWGRALVQGRPRLRSLIIAFWSRFRRRHT